MLRLAIADLPAHDFGIRPVHFRHLHFLQFARARVHLYSHPPFASNFDSVWPSDSGGFLDIDVLDSIQSSCMVGMALRPGALVGYSDFSRGITF